MSGLVRLMGAAGPVRLSEAQRQVAGIIAEEFTAAGLGSVVPAALVNAYAESRLNPNAIGDSGASVGLFQLHSRGAGAGMSVAARQDPRINTRRIIEVVRKNPVVIELANRGDVPGSIAAFVRYVERPADIPGQIAARQALAEPLLGQLGSLVRPAGSGDGWGFLVGLVLVGVMGAGAVPLLVRGTRFY